MTKVLLINGSAHENGCTARALREVAGALEKNGVAAELLWLGSKPIPDCNVCGQCAKTGRCVFKDDAVDQVLDRLDEYDGLVFGSPVYYAGPTGALCSFMDRLFYASRGRMAGKVAAAVVNARRAGTTAALDRLYKYFSISDMLTAWPEYWNMTFGRGGEDNQGDLEGLRNMRVLGENMAWLLKSLEAGRDAGIAPPVHEPRTQTNFIR